MTNEPRNDISVISETPVMDGLGHFLVALGWAIIAGTLALAFGLLLIGPLTLDFGGFLAAALFFSVFVGLFTLMGMVAIGLPTTLLLWVLRSEYAALYAGVGAVAGFLILSIGFDAHRLASLEDIVLPASGAAAGLAGAWRWGWWRERVANAKRSGANRYPTDKRDNPIHDLTH